MLPAPPPAPAAFFLGTYGPGVYAATLDRRTGAISAPTLAAEAKDPSFVALSPDGRRLYAALESSGRVAAFAVAGLRLRPLNARPSGGSGPCHVSVAPDGRTALAANYGDGVISAFALGADGALGAPRTAPGLGSGAHGHFVAALGPFAYACDLGTDEVRIFRLGARGAGAGESGVGGLTPQPSARVPAGAGARHLAFGRGGRFVYVLNEMAITVTAFARDGRSGGLTSLGTVPALPPGADRAGASGAEIAVHPNGRFVYASIRGGRAGADRLTSYAVGRDGGLEPIETVEAGVRTPRSFAIDPSGRWLVAAGQGSGELASFRIDARTGRLTPAGRAALAGAKPVCVAFAPR